MEPRIAWEWTVSLLTSTGAAALFAWLFKESLGRALDRDVHRDLERYKSELALRSQHEIERLKSELQLQAHTHLESVRHEMQKQLLRAQLATTRTQDVYSTLIHLLRKSEGDVAAIWPTFGYAPDYRRYSEEDLLKVLEDAKAPGLDNEEIKALLRTNKREAIKRIEEVLQQRTRNNAQRSHAEANNHVVLEGLFMTKAVRDKANEILRLLWGAWVANHVGNDAPPDQRKGFFDSFSENMQKASVALGELEDLMRGDLLPASIDPDAHAR
jgi:DNA-binding transcriptional MerR regulator